MRPRSPFTSTPGAAREKQIPISMIPQLATAGVAIGVAIYVAVAWALFDGRTHWLGSESYVHIAANLLQGEGYTINGLNPTACRPPGFPTILMAVMAVAGNHWFAATVGLHALAALACLWMVFNLTSRYWPATAAPWIATGLMLFHGPFMIEMIALRETVWFTLGLLGVATLSFRPKPISAASALGVGSCLALLHLLRPTGLIIAVVTLVYLAWAARGGTSQRFLAVGLAALTAGVLVLPWQIYTARAFGAPGFFPSSLSGYNLSKGTLPELTAVYPWIDADHLDPRVRALVSPISLTDERAAGTRFKEIAWKTIRETSPASLAARRLVNAAAFIAPVPVPLGSGQLSETPQGVGIQGFRLNWMSMAFAPWIALILVAGALGLRAMGRSDDDQKRFARWMGIIFAVLLAVHSLTFVKTRYRLPLDALVAVSAAGWLGSRNLKSPTPGGARERKSPINQT